MGLFACSRILSGTFVRPGGSPGGRAVGLFIPIAVSAVTAMLLGRPEIAVGIVFGSSVGAMTTVIGFAALANPIGGGPMRWRRVWCFPLAAALIALVAGFKGLFHWRDAIALFLEGIVVLSLWREVPVRRVAAVSGEQSDSTGAGEAAGDGTGGATGDASGGSAGGAAGVKSDEQTGYGPVLDYRSAGAVAARKPFFEPLTEATPALEEQAGAAPAATAGREVAAESGGSSDGGREGFVMILELVLALAALVLASWAVTTGTVAVGIKLRNFSTAGLAASIVSLALVMPMTYGAWTRSSGGRSWEPMTTQVGVVLLNFCLLLPALIMIPYLAAGPAPFLSTWAGDALAYGEGLAKPLIFPAAFWRIDNVILIVAGVLMLPVSAGKWKLGREEGMALIAGYFFYLTSILLAAGKL